MDREEDRKLVEAVLSGGDEGWRDLNALLNGPARPGLWAAARRFGIPYDDVRQELAVLLLASGGRVLRTFRGDSKLSTWLTTVTYNLCRRRAGREREYRERLRQMESRAREEFDRSAGAHSPLSPQEEACDRKLEWSKVMRVAKRLNERQQLIFLAWANGEEIEPVAGALGITVENARVVLHRAIKLIRAWLTDGEAEGK